MPMPEHIRSRTAHESNRRATVDRDHLREAVALALSATLSSQWSLERLLDRIEAAQ